MIEPYEGLGGGRSPGSAASRPGVDELVQAMGLTGVSKSQVSKLYKDIDERVITLPSWQHILAIAGSSLFSVSEMIWIIDGLMDGLGKCLISICFNDERGGIPSASS